MTLNVNVYQHDEAGEMIFHDTEDHADTMAGFEVCRTSLYGSELAHSLGLVLLPSLAGANIYASGEEVMQLKAEVEVIIGAADAFAGVAGLEADYVRHRAGNIRRACLRALEAQRSVMVW